MLPDYLDIGRLTGLTETMAIIKVKPVKVAPLNTSSGLTAVVDIPASYTEVSDKLRR